MIVWKCFTQIPRAPGCKMRWKRVLHARNYISAEASWSISYLNSRNCVCMHLAMSQCKLRLDWYTGTSGLGLFLMNMCFNLTVTPWNWKIVLPVHNTIHFCLISFLYCESLATQTYHWNFTLSLFLFDYILLCNQTIKITMMHKIYFLTTFNTKDSKHKISLRLERVIRLCVDTVITLCTVVNSVCKYTDCSRF